MADGAAKFWNCGHVQVDAAWAGLPQDGPMIWSRLREYPGCELHRTDHRGVLWGRPMPSSGRNEAEWMDG
ncbi:hypothetical protein RR48_03568 [Papilio machaon]|uniref:Uncharacterized protein n=1 Tax=Papilio machaon TaxID=76193 RepID=A0A0N1IEV9_PAPMA|nr:hypothetical protein RR48_03568 [Papilio machaon]